MNKVDKLLKQIDDFEEKKMKQIERIQSKCKHKNVIRWSDYGGINEQCKDCKKWLR